MNKLTNITFTGLDANTDISRLIEIQKKYPIAEFGVLMSKNWEHNGNRYPNPELIQRFLDQGLNLSAHLCGHIAREAYRGYLEPVMSIYQAFEHPDFKRTQLNISPYESIYEQAGTLRLRMDKEFIIQQHSPTILHSKGFGKFEDANPLVNVTMLIDPSGGKGIDTGLDIIATDRKTGYAGGINEDNVEDKLRTLLSMDTVNEFWIDMESGVRTNDWFDLDKVERVLEKCDNILKEF